MAAGQAALLVGFGHGPGEYRTLLITFRDGKAQLAADIPALIVPRKDGFWRVGVLHNGDDRFYTETLYAIPATSKPPSVQPNSPSRNKTEDSPEDCSTNSGETIHFVNPELVSVEEGSYSDCNLPVSGSTGFATYKINDLDKRLDISSVLGPAGWAALKRTAASKFDDDCQPSQAGTTDWSIERESGEWTVVSSPSCPQMYQPYDVDFTLPVSVAGPTYRAAERDSMFETIKRVATRKYDSVLTPAGDFLIMFDLPIRVYGVNRNALAAAPSLSIPNNGGDGVPVMIQWAMGRFVAQWESSLREIAVSLAKEPPRKGPKQ